MLLFGKIIFSVDFSLDFSVSNAVFIFLDDLKIFLHKFISEFVSLP